MIRKLILATMLLTEAFAFSSCEKEEITTPSVEKVTMSELENIPSLNKGYTITYSTNEYIWFFDGHLRYFDMDKSKYSTGMYFKSCVIDGYNITLTREEGWDPSHDVVYKGYISKLENSYCIFNFDPENYDKGDVGNLPEELTGEYIESMVNLRP